MQDKTVPDGNELTVNLVRLRMSDHGTEGILFFRHFSCFTMELPWRENQRNISCIPAGIYSVQLRQAGRQDKCAERKRDLRRVKETICQVNLARGSVADGTETYFI